MAEFVLKVQQGGRTLAEWRVGDEPLDLVLSDPDSGREVARFQASVPDTTDEISPDPEDDDEVSDERTDTARDDFTMPMPEDGVPVMATDSTSDDIELDSDAAAAAGAEVWIRREGEWQQAGWLVPRQRVSTQGGWIKQAKDGRVVVCAGKKLHGTATLPDGRTSEVRPGSDAVAYPAGTSVLLGAGPHGIYVRSTAWAGRALGAVSFAST